MTEKNQLNIFDEQLEECSCDPLTGFFRSGVAKPQNMIWAVIQFVP